MRHVCSNPASYAVTPSSESIAMIPVVADGRYQLFDHVPRQTFFRLIRNILVL